MGGRLMMGFNSGLLQGGGLNNLKGGLKLIVVLQ